MTVADMARLLEGISQGLGDLLTKPGTTGLAAISECMRPFGALTIEQFAGFLKRCEEYQRTGVVTPVASKAKPARKPTVPTLSVPDAAAKFRGMLAEIDRGTVTEARIDALVNELKAMKKPELDRLLPELQIAGKHTKEVAARKLRELLNFNLHLHLKHASFDVG